MRRRAALQAFALLPSAWLTGLLAQESKPVPVVGVPLIAAGPNDEGTMMQLRLGLREHGYIDGENVRVEHRFGEGKVERVPELIRELLRLDVDVIVAGAEPIVKAARAATRTTPIVMIGWDYDPVAAALVESLNRPGGNVTGVYMRLEETTGKRLELLKELLPGLSRIALLYDSFGRREFAQVEPAARTLGLQVVPIDIGDPYDFDAAFKRARTRKVEALVALFSPHFYVNRQRLAEAALAQRVAVMSANYGYVRAGTLISYGPSPEDGWRRAGYFVARVLKGALPGELPVERPAVYRMVVNLRTAKTLGLGIPESMLLRADEIIR
jgi:putative ABC transport system substrate-binding protein